MLVKSLMLKQHPEIANLAPSVREKVLDGIVQKFLSIPKVSDARISLEGYYQLKGIDVRKRPDFKGFITTYAKSDPEENFCEMFAFYCRGDLPNAQAVLFEKVISGMGDLAYYKEWIEA